MEKPFESPIYVTRPYMPPVEEYSQRMRQIWDTQWLTNNGPILQRYQQRLSDYFGTENLCLFNNGTLALQIGLQGMGISGEVITTPYTFVATTHALYWNKIRPVFVDIEEDFYTIDPEKIEEAITPWTTAILAVHVYGYPCRLEELSAIARKHNLLLIYDAAHAFGVKIDGKPLSTYGDLSMYSFHATKLYHSIEGGMLIFGDKSYMRTFDYLKNFGFENEVEVIMPGTNAKMNEFQAVMGELVLEKIDSLIEKRASIYNRYCEELSDIPGIIPPRRLRSGIEHNYAYMPIEVEERAFGKSRDQVYEELMKYNVFARRYFYPLICDYTCYRALSVEDPLTNARRVASRIMTLPIYHDLELDDVARICRIIAHIQKES